MKNPSFQNPKPLFSLVLFLLLISIFPGVNSQSNNNNNSNPNDDNQYQYANFNPSIAIIIVVLVAALFFMGFFSFYIRHCADDNSAGSIRNMLSVHRRANARQRGIEEAVLETFPTFSYAEVKDHKVGKGALECAVCLNEFEDDETLRLIPKCDHVFHAECIDAWLQGHATCPVCRADLTLKPGEESDNPTEATQELPVSDSVPENNDGVTIQIDPQPTQDAPGEVKPEVNRNLSFGNINRPPRGDSVRGGRKSAFRFRSHSTGHSLVQPGENLDRFTLRLPQEIRKEMMNRALLNRTKSFATGDGSTRRGVKSGFQEGSSIGGRSFRRLDQSDRTARSDRWIFSTAAPFFSRALSVRSPKVVAENSEGPSWTSKGVKTAVRMPSFKCLEPKSADETGLVQADSVRPPV